MPLPELDNLVRIGKLKAEPPAQNETLSPESRFDLAYNAAHAFSLAALRWHGYRSENRYLVFQSLTHTLNLPAPSWRVLDDAHRKRNLAEYEDEIEVDDALLMALSELAVDTTSHSFSQAEFGRDCCFVAFEHASPAQIVLQVLGGHTVEATHPTFEPTVVSIDVLDVKDAIEDAWAMLNVKRPVGDSGGTGEGGINAGAVGAQNGFLIEQRLECRDHVCRIELFQFEVSGLSAAVAHHEHRNLFGAEAALAGYATPVAGWPG